MKRPSTGLGVGLWIVGGLVGLYVLGGSVFYADVRFNGLRLIGLLSWPMQDLLYDIFNPLIAIFEGRISDLIPRR